MVTCIGLSCLYELESIIFMTRPSGKCLSIRILSQWLSLYVNYFNLDLKRNGVDHREGVVLGD